MRQPRQNRFRRSSGLGTALELLVTHPSRYLVHGVVAAIGLATLGVVAAEPRPTSVAAAYVAPPPAAVAPADASDASAPDPIVSTESLSDVPPPVDEMATIAAAQPAPPAPPKPQHHAVEDGENLRMIAAKFGVSPETILAANSIDDPDVLMVGQDLVIPPVDGALHTLKDGESLNSVAQAYGIDVNDLIKANDVGSDPNVILPGVQLVVPGVDPTVNPFADDGSAASTDASTDSSSSGSSDSDASGSGEASSGGSSDQQAASDGPSTAIRDRSSIPSTRTYEVQPGDTLNSIADTFGVDVATILSSNGIQDPDTVMPGVDLSILPVKGVQYTVQPDETLADIAWKYQIDLGVLLDYNNLDNPDLITVGTQLVIPGGHLQALPPAASSSGSGSSGASSAASSAATTSSSTSSAAAAPARSSRAGTASSASSASSSKPAASASSSKSTGSTTQVAASAAPKPKPAAAAAPVASSGGAGGGSIVGTAMSYIGSRYVFGGTGPSGFDCSGFVYYVLNHSGTPVGRSMYQEYNAGSHVSQGNLKPGDVVFFANTYMPGMSHVGIYVGGGQFVHAADESTGVTVSSLNSSYWQSHYVGATRVQ